MTLKLAVYVTKFQDEMVPGSWLLVPGGCGNGV